MRMEEKALLGINSIKPYLDKLTLGVTRVLEASPGVTEVTFVEKEPAERHAIVSWEQKNACVLPEDLKNFYLMTDGFHMTWSVKFDDNPMPLGSMTINSISKLNRLGASSVYTLPNAPTLADLEDTNKEGVVTPDSEIWFLDRALYWHFLTKTFTSYYRLLITHLGLPQWQYAFTSYGVSPQAKQWFNMYKPITINTEQLSEESDSFVNKLDPNKVFRTKSKTPVMKKKLPPQPPSSQKGQTGTASKNPPLAGSSLRRREAPQL
ncbi:tubulin polyglutamylase complex subunit 2 isoform X2 [Rhineura floridana]|uniref:tubulin polyglutamylase complex subunit 2 isoform X2 n=1 Tax=Rhineura floridana TaxID=261503 RepID=UPI002AC855F8|nr:tubulin polyglutamylase complex subunit 2 isoform X2 [Rhineura floridana]